MRLLDIDTFEIIHQELAYTTNIGTLIKTTETVEATAELDQQESADVEKTEPAQEVATEFSRFPIGVKIVDDGMLIDRLAQQLYPFRVVTTESDSPIPSIYLTQIVLNKTSMKILDED